MRDNREDITDNYLTYSKKSMTDVYLLKTRYAQAGDDEHEWLDVEMTDGVSGDFIREHIDEIIKGGFDSLAVLQEGCENYWGLKYRYPNVKLIWFLFDSYIDDDSIIYNVGKRK